MRPNGTRAVSVDRFCAVPAIWATVRADRPVLAFAVRSSPTGADGAGVQASLRCRYVGRGRALLAVLAGNDVRAHGREIEPGARVRVRIADQRRVTEVEQGLAERVQHSIRII